MYTDFKPKYHDVSLPGSPLRIYGTEEEFHSYKKGLLKDIFRGKGLTTTKHSLREQTDDLNNERRGYKHYIVYKHYTAKMLKFFAQGTAIDLLELTSFLLGYVDSHIAFISSIGFSHNWPGPRRGNACVGGPDVNII